MAKANIDFLDRLQGFTEGLLTRRARKQERRRRKQKARGPVLDWIDAFLWAAMVVLLLNQYLLQAYQIPSGSMRGTLIGGVDPRTGRMSTGDRIFVDKFSFGPEVLPGVGKLPGFLIPLRADVIIFENPSYESRGPAFDVLQRVIYMLTLSLVNIDRDQDSGEDAHSLLIKRQVAEEGDRVVFDRGAMYIQPQGYDHLLSEDEFKELSNLDYGNNLLLDDSYYDKLEATVAVTHYQRAGLPIPEEWAEAAATNWVTSLKKAISDPYAFAAEDAQISRILYPQDQGVSQRAAVYERGHYVPEGWVLPIGDNRSDSGDGRYFGPIPREKVLGRALFIYWPLGRLGGIR